MLTPKCRLCGSLWHYKPKCPERENKPLRAVYKRKGTDTPLSPENPSKRPRLAYKGNSERSQLIGWADKFFGLYIRVTGGDGFVNWCYTCGARTPISDIQCGHFISRRFVNTRWNKLNCHPQCNECNVDKHGNLKVYERRLRSDYGDIVIDQLKQIANSSNKFTIMDIQDIIDEYRGVVF